MVEREYRQMTMDMVDKNTSRSRASYNSIIPIALNAAAHPIAYVKLLIQVGHEPLPAQEGKTLLGRSVLKLPNLIQYAKHIKQTDGWLGLYRGLGPRITCNVVNSAVSNAINRKVKEENVAAGKFAVDDSSFTGFLQETMNLAVARTCGVVVSYPFHLISIRMMVQFIGRETEYTSILSSVRDIYNDEGITGFFTGLLPHLIGELLGLWAFRTLHYVVINYVIGADSHTSGEIRSVTQGLSQYVVSTVTYPFQLVANIMAVNGTKLAAGQPPLMPLYSSWTECWVELGRKGLRNRGASLFRRTLPLPSN